MAIATWCRALAGAAGVLALGLCGMASGAVYQGRFDPLAFQGTIEVDVPSGCLRTASDGQVWVSATSCGGVDLLSLVATNEPAPPVIDSLDFAPPTDASAVFGLWWDNGVLAGVDTSIIGPQFASTGAWFDPNTPYGMEFVSGHAPDATGSPIANLWTCFSGDQLASSDAPKRARAKQTGGCDPQEIVGVATQEGFAPVPEPETLALMALALAGMGALRRRTHS